jgi:hypothetical protein
VRASDVSALGREDQMIALAIDTQKQFLVRIRQPAGAPEYRPCLKEFISATEVNLERLERRVQRDLKQKEAASARRRSVEAVAEYKQAARQAQEARARIAAAEEEAQRLEQECAAMSDRSSREASPESAASSTRRPGERP